MIVTRKLLKYFKLKALQASKRQKYYIIRRKTNKELQSFVLQFNVEPDIFEKVQILF